MVPPPSTPPIESIPWYIKLGQSSPVRSWNTVKKAGIKVSKFCWGFGSSVLLYQALSFYPTPDPIECQSIFDL